MITIMQLRGGSAKTAAVAAMPAPGTPDYHTRECFYFCCVVVVFHFFYTLSHLPPPTPPPPLPTFTIAIVVSSDIPSFGTPEWEAFIEKDANNMQVWLEAQFKE